MIYADLQHKLENKELFQYLFELISLQNKFCQYNIQLMHYFDLLTMKNNE